MVSGKKSDKVKLLDKLLADSLFATSELAEKQVRAGLVRVNGEVVDKPGVLVSRVSVISVEQRKEFVGRGALKLAGALDTFKISPAGLVCVDVGACTGGFTDVLLQRGANKVYAIDVGYGDLDWKIRTDPRVVVMERTNVRYVASLPEPISLVTIDVSFISLTKVLGVVAQWLPSGGTVIALIKPQFEAAKDEVGEGGVITDVAVQEKVVERIVDFLPSVSLAKSGVTPSPILGTEGNKEFLLWATKI
jgi:23S rRNA (cytidine1920-2'-O)/16S rRNA (cytidine1409-2'-O)-methyltransferase